MTLPLGQPPFAGAFSGAFAGAFSQKGTIQAIDPVSLPNLSIGFSADTGVNAGSPSNGDPVTDWADQSTNGNDAEQTTVNRQPTFNSTGINGKPSLTWDRVAGQEDRMIIPDDNSLDYPQGYSSFVVCQPSSYAVFPTFWSKGSNDNRFIINSSTGLFCAATPTTGPTQVLTSPGPGTLPTVGTPLIVEAHFEFGSNKRVRFFANGLTLGVRAHTLNDIKTNSATMDLGFTPAASNQTFIGEYRAVYINTGVLTGSQILGVRKFLSEDSDIAVGNDI